MDNFPKALAHGEFEEVFPDVFFLTGAMETVLMEKDWQFSRNMVVVRENESLTIFNSIRLNEIGLAALDKLGTVTDIVRVGALHGRDDDFYLTRYNATLWTLPGLDAPESAREVKHLTADCKLPITDASVFIFEQTNIPESIILLAREGGILIGCDAIQNWTEADEYFSEESTQVMTNMGFFTPANIGPVWMQAAEPKLGDFERLQTLTYQHALCGHGRPLKETAKEAYQATFEKLFPSQS